MSNLMKTLTIGGSTYEVCDAIAREALIELDTTLSVEGAAADAKAVGDAISNLSGGNDVVGIDQVITTTSTDPGGTNALDILLTDGTSHNLTVKNGINGSNGITPHIGDNGNWYIGDTDTGMPSRGEDGLPGVSVPGDPGEDGVSPVVSVSTITGGHRITITDVDGTKTVDVMDGTDGSDGSPGQDGSPGADGKDGNGIKSAVLNADYTLTLTFDDGTSYTTPSIRGATGAVGSDGEDGAAGQRGTGVLKITTATTSASGTGTTGAAIKYKIALATVKSEAGVDEVLVGDTVLRSYYIYPVVMVDDNYVYLGAYTSIRGSTGTAGSAGTSVTVSSVTESDEDGGENVVAFSDGNTLTVKNGRSGVHVGETEPTDDSANVWINPDSGVAIIPTIEHNTCSIFRKVVCVGDSFTSGHIQTGEESVGTNEDYSWPSYLARLTGNEYINCGSSGATVFTWLTMSRGLTKAQTTGVVQAYLVGLGLNDVWNVDLGTAADIGTDAQTYYAGMSRIIRELNAISPKAKIFVQTMASNSSTNMQYNAAIREVVAAYADTYPVYVLDLEAYLPMYKTDLILGDKINGHYTAIGYQMFAENLRVIWSEYINNHIADFQDVYTLPYGTT